MIQLPREFKEFLQLLHSESVDYLLVGGIAVWYHGYPRATADMDIWAGASPENAERLANALVRFGFSRETVDREFKLIPGQAFQIGFPPLRIELLTTISGVEFASCYSRRITDLVDGVPVHLISLDDLKINKRAAGRNKDLADLDELP